MSLFTPDFGSDQGPRCVCGGTIYGYKLEKDMGGMWDIVRTQCYTCHLTDTFYPDTTPKTAAECSAAHRASKE